MTDLSTLISWAVVNNRIATDSSLAFLQDHYTSLIRNWAIANNTTLMAFGNTILDQGSTRKVELSDAWGTALEPAPVSPIDALPFRLLSGTIRAVGSGGQNTTENDEKLFVAPSVMSGKSKNYWES